MLTLTHMHSQAHVYIHMHTQACTPTHSYVRVAVCLIPYQWQTVVELGI